MENMRVISIKEHVLKNILPVCRNRFRSIIKELLDVLNEHHLSYRKKFEEYSQKKQLDKHLESVLEKKLSLAEELKKLNDQIEQRRKELEIQEKKVAVSSQVVSMFKQHLALKIKKSQNGEISFIFSQIDKEHPDHCCVFNLFLENNVYKLTKCKPEVDGIEVLMSELNKTNDLSSFVVSMRQKFCSLLIAES